MAAEKNRVAQQSDSVFSVFSLLAKKAHLKLVGMVSI
jgi:hypothetical protein